MVQSPDKFRKKEGYESVENKSPGTKYHGLLSSNKRGDNFKGSFQLKLISGDDPELIVSPGKEKMESTQEYQEVLQENYSHNNIIMPPKMEIDPFAQEVIDKFYENQENGNCHVNI